jgi:arylsulfatase
MQAFAAMVSDLDIQVGRILDWLDKSGQADNTIILFLSDNGYEGHDLRHGFTEAADFAKTFDNSLDRIGKPDSYVWMGPDWGRASSAPFRLYKGYPTEGGTRVPFLVSYPGLKRSGMVAARGHVSDVMPTLLDLAGVRHPGTRFAGRRVFAMSGKSMLLSFGPGGTDPCARSAFRPGAVRQACDPDRTLEGDRDACTLWHRALGTVRYRHRSGRTA